MKKGNTCNEFRDDAAAVAHIAVSPRWYGTAFGHPDDRVNVGATAANTFTGHIFHV